MAHDALAGTASSYTATANSTGVSKSPTSYYIYRAFFPFDTSSIPDDATITSAELNIYVTGRVSNDNDGDDFVTVVQTSQPSATTLSTADFDQAGSINNPTEGISPSERKDITNIAVFKYLTFNLNSTGLGWISKTDVTKLGLREGHDVIDSAFTSFSTTTRSPTISPVPPEYQAPLKIRILYVTYTQPATNTTTRPSSRGRLATWTSRSRQTTYLYTAQHISNILR